MILSVPSTPTGERSNLSFGSVELDDYLRGMPVEHMTIHMVSKARVPVGTRHPSGSRVGETHRSIGGPKNEASLGRDGPRKRRNPLHFGGFRA